MSLLSQINTKKLLLSLIPVFVFSSSAFAGCISGDCSNGYGTYSWNDGSGEQYVGEWKNGKMNGKGVTTYANGKRDEGIWEDDKLTKVFKSAPILSPRKTKKIPISIKSRKKSKLTLKEAKFE